MTLTKINQLSTPAQATRWQSRMDIVGLCICRGNMPQPPWIPLAAAKTLRDLLCGVRVAVALNPKDEFGAAEIAHIIAELNADYYEYTPVDFLKQSEFAAELTRVSNLGCRKIANGYFIQRDDCGFLDKREPYREMMRAGVELFQFEVDTPDDSELSRSDLRRANEFFEEVPALICDSALQLRDCPIVSARGFFFNIAALPSNANYDCSSVQRTESDIARALRAIRPGASPQ